MNRRRRGGLNGLIPFNRKNRRDFSHKCGERADIIQVGFVLEPQPQRRSVAVRGERLSDGRYSSQEKT